MYDIHTNETTFQQNRDSVDLRFSRVKRRFEISSIFQLSATTYLAMQHAVSNDSINLYPETSLGAMNTKSNQTWRYKNCLAPEPFRPLSSTHFMIIEHTLVLVSIVTLQNPSNWPDLVDKIFHFLVSSNSVPPKLIMQHTLGIIPR